LLEDSQVIALVKNGDVDAFADIIERYQVSIFRYVYRLTGNRDITLDIMQVTFMRAYEGLLKTQIKVSFKAWLYRIATNNVLQLRRHNRVVSFVPLGDDLINNALADGDRSQSLETRLDVQNTLAKIPRKLRICMLLHFVEGFKYQEIAQTLKISEEAVRKRVIRGSREFRRLYNSQEVMRDEV
jgi:RNA polymerase sigma factor (sigma-70 family)